MIMVTHLLTITIKVNIPSSAESQFHSGVTIMKKVKTGRGFWTWLMGGGWASGMSNA
jgi:hypothetical protein